MEYLIGVDIGTLGSKGIIIDSGGNIISQQFVEHDIKILKPGWVEQNSEVFWNDFKIIVKFLIEHAKINPERIAAVGISGLVPDVVPVDDSGNPIRDCIIYMDRRAVKEAEWVKNIMDEERIYDVSGNAIDPYFAGYKCLWFQRNEPHNYLKTWKILDGSKYVVYKLTSREVLDYATGPLFAPFFNIRSKTWDRKTLNILNFDVEKLPDIVSPIDIIGEVTKNASIETGLPEGCKVIAGGPDYQFSAFSAGLTSPGDTMIMYGTTGLLAIVLDRPLFDPRLVNSLYILPNRYMSFGGMATTGALVRWFRDQFGFLEKEVERLTGINAYNLLDAEASSIPPGSDGVVILPYFMGERTPIWDPTARGVIIGLTLYHTRGHIYRALLESTGYALKQHLEIAKELGISIKRVVAVNGGAKSPLWRGIVSDIIGLPQQYISTTMGAPYGDAFLSGVAVKIFDKPEDINNFIKVDEETNPNIKNSTIYAKFYDVYSKLYPSLKDYMRKLAET